MEVNASTITFSGPLERLTTWLRAMANELEADHKRAKQDPGADSGYIRTVEAVDHLGQNFMHYNGVDVTFTTDGVEDDEDAVIVEVTT